MKFNIIVKKYSSDKYIIISNNISDSIHEILSETELPVIDESSAFLKLSLQHFALHSPSVSWL